MVHVNFYRNCKPALKILPHSSLFVTLRSPFIFVAGAP